MGGNRAVSVSGKGALEPCGACGGAMGGLRGLALWDLGAFDPDAGRPGLCGLVGGWSRLTKSSPNESDSLEFGGCSMTPESTVLILVLSQGSEFLQISHHEKF